MNCAQVCKMLAVTRKSNAASEKERCGCSISKERRNVSTLVDYLRSDRFIVREIATQCPGDKSSVRVSKRDRLSILHSSSKLCANATAHRLVEIEISTDLPNKNDAARRTIIDVEMDCIPEVQARRPARVLSEMSTRKRVERHGAGLSRCVRVCPPGFVIDRLGKPSPIHQADYNLVTF